MIKEQEEKSTMMYSNTYYILPMLQLNKSSFGVGNFINSYVDVNGYVVVDLRKEAANKNTAELIYNHPYYVTDYDVEDYIRVVYAIPDNYLPDLQRFIDGKYSQFSSELKVAISKYANLNAQGVWIKCLNPQLIDRQMIADNLGVNVDIVRELKSAPSEGNYIKIK